MKKAVLFLTIALLVLLTLPLLGTLLAACFGYTLELTGIAFLSVVTAVLSAFETFLLIRLKEMTMEAALLRRLIIPLAPVSLFHAFFFVFQCNMIQIIACETITVVACIISTMPLIKTKASNKVMHALLGIELILFGCFSILMLTFGRLGENTVVDSIQSPSGAYYAQVINSDQGALGGDTLVKVYRAKSFDAGIFKIYKTPLTVCSGRWGEAFTMEVHWEGDSCLLIDQTEYSINGF